MPHCCVQVEKANTGFKDCAKEKGDSITLAEARRIQSQLTQRMTQTGDVIQPKDSDSAHCNLQSSSVQHIYGLSFEKIVFELQDSA